MGRSPFSSIGIFTHIVNNTNVNQRIYCNINFAEICTVGTYIQMYSELFDVLFLSSFFKRAAQQNDLMETLIWTSVAGCLLVKQILESLFQLD